MNAARAAGAPLGLFPFVQLVRFFQIERGGLLSEELWVLKMKIILAWSIGAYVGVVIFVNALFILVSPRAWFRLPW